MCTVVTSGTDVESLDTGVQEAAQVGWCVVRSCSRSFQGGKEVARALSNGDPASDELCPSGVGSPVLLLRWLNRR